MLNVFTNTETGFSLTTHMGSEGSTLAKSLSEFRAAELRATVADKSQQTEETMMKVKIENLAFCQCCTRAAINDDYTGLDYYYSTEDANTKENRKYATDWAS